MTTNGDFDDLIILGNGYSAHLAAIALAPVLPVAAMVGPAKRRVEGGLADGLAGQHAHSHIFLPRLERELDLIDPQLLPMMAAHGHRFVPGSGRLRDDAPSGCRRLFATRWQFDDAIEALFRQRVQPRHVDASVSGIETQAGETAAVSLSSGGQIPISRSTLVLDATGTKSPVMKALSAGDESLIDRPGNVVYITQFFRRPDSQTQPLPDPLIDCPHDFGGAAVMLYPGADGWFSISLAIDAGQKPLIRELRDRAAFLSFCRQSPHVAAWIDGARVEGPNRIFINPRTSACSTTALRRETIWPSAMR